MALIFLAPLALRGILDDLLRQWPGEVTVEIMLNPEVPRAVRAGRGWDVAMSNPDIIAGLIAEGRAGAASHAAFGAVPLALGAASAPASTATEEKALAALLRGASRVAFTEAGTSGALFHEACARLGVLSDVQAALLPLGGGGPVAAVASGEADLAAAPLTTLRAAPGVEVAGVFPDAIAHPIEMSVCTPPEARATPEARDFCRWLVAPDLDPWLAAHGVARFNLPA